MRNKIEFHESTKEEKTGEYAVSQDISGDLKKVTITDIYLCFGVTINLVYFRSFIPKGQKRKPIRVPLNIIFPLKPKFIKNKNHCLSFYMSLLCLKATISNTRRRPKESE